MMQQVTIWTKVVLPGFHQWPQAPAHRSYLADKHRHLFHVTVTVVVDHLDREIEFHDLRDVLTLAWGAGTVDWGKSSCESIAIALRERLADRYEINASRIEVSEDGESGAIVEWT
jgi:hypothetical protein